MNLLTLALIISFTLTILTFGAAWVLSTRSLCDREKTSPFECGFDPKNNARIPFSLRFFLLGLIFIVFDIEIVLVMPAPLLSFLAPFPYAYITLTIFLIILMLGLLHEWREGSLNWSS